MEFIITDAEKMEAGKLKSFDSLDIEVGDSNDFEIQVSRECAEYLGFGAYIFSEDTEYGGRIEALKGNTYEDGLIWTGLTWRGLLEQIIIEPPPGLPYREVDGEANKVIREVLRGYELGCMFSIPEVDSGIRMKGQFDRYVSAAAGFTALLEKQNARLSIKAKSGGTGEPFSVLLQAVPITNYSQEIEYSQDNNRVNLDYEDYRCGINHLICLGKGELTERLVVHLYVQLDGSIGRKKYFEGIEERTAVYDYSSAEDEAALIEYGEKRLKELMNYRKAEMTVDDLEVEIGDIIAARDRETGIYLSKPIVRKILKVKGGMETIEYKVKGEN